MIRIYHNNNSHGCLTWQKQKNNLFTLSLDFYDHEGYYVAHKSNNLKNVTLDYINRQISAAKAMVKDKMLKRVEIYQ